MLLFLVIFTLLFAAAAFGAVYLLVRNTPLASHSVLLSIASFQPFLIICITLLGYRKPDPLWPLQVFIPLLAGIGLTMAVIVRCRHELASVLRPSFKGSLLIYGLAIGSMILATPLILGSTSLAYIDWWNGELINYSYFAQFFLGLLRDPNYIPGFEGNTSLRYGAELFLASMSVMTGKMPLFLIEVLSAFHKCSAVLAFSVSCEAIRKERKGSAVAFGVAYAGFAFAAILSLNHVLAFFAAQAVTASFILVSLILLTRNVQTFRVQVFLAVHVLFIVITYGEALPFLGLVGGLLVIEALWRREYDPARRVLTVVGMGLLVNPMLLLQRLGHLYRLRNAIAGFNVLGTPVDNLSDYLAVALGFRYQFLNVRALPDAWVPTGNCVALAVITAGFAVGARRLRAMLFLAIPVLLLLVHVNILPSIQPSGTAYYKCYKTIAALYFFVFLGVALLLDELAGRRPWRRLSGAFSIALLASIGVWIASNMFVTIRAAAAIKAVPSVYREGALRHALDAVGSGPVLVIANDINSSFWDLIMNAFGIRRLLLDEKQAEIVYHNSPVVLLDAPVVAGSAEGRDRAAPAVLFSGKIIVPQISGYSPALQPMNARAVLDAIQPGLRLQERRVLFANAAFRMVDGELVSTGNPDAAADGSANRPPSVLGLFPNVGNGRDGEMDFSYTDPNGYADITAVLINISSGQPGSNGCYLSYGRLANQLGLVQDGGVAWKTELLGSGKTLENSFCAIDSARSSINGVGTKLALHLVLRFKGAFKGRNTVYTTVVDGGQLTTGWRPVGWWTIP